MVIEQLNVFDFSCLEFVKIIHRYVTIAVPEINDSSVE